MPEPLAIPPMTASRPPIDTRTAASFGNGSVVMIARAATEPWSWASAPIAAGRPVRIFSMLERDADDAGRGDQHLLDAAADAAAPSRRPSRAPRPDPRRRCRRWRTRCSRRSRAPRRASPRDVRSETMTGAAWARFVVKTAAAVAGRSETSSARSRPSLGLDSGADAGGPEPFRRGDAARRHLEDLRGGDAHAWRSAIEKPM